MLCHPPVMIRELASAEVWSDDLWRLLTRISDSPVLGFSYLIPRRHIPYITDLDGAEAATLGSVLASVTSALKDAARAEYVFVTVFGERAAHLHFNLAPHIAGDSLKGGAGMLDADSTAVPDDELGAVADRVRLAMARD
jgi:diadenosine tetraphosphate (Ap4A) HIT family hydrolase